MIYGYVRVSSVTQNIDRQMEEMKKIGLEKNKFILIFKVERILIVKNIKD